MRKLAVRQRATAEECARKTANGCALRSKTLPNTGVTLRSVRATAWGALRQQARQLRIGRAQLADNSARVYVKTAWKKAASRGWCCRESTLNPGMVRAGCNH